jgi:hypothetical protein
MESGGAVVHFAWTVISFTALRADGASGSSGLLASVCSWVWCEVTAHHTAQEFIVDALRGRASVVICVHFIAPFSCLQCHSIGVANFSLCDLVAPCHIFEKNVGKDRKTY